VLDDLPAHVGRHFDNLVIGAAATIGGLSRDGTRNALKIHFV
jgi:hypothetical protein